jgi:predicted dehydrogenase
MNIGLLGCGFASDAYVTTLRNHRHMRLAGVPDHDCAPSIAAASGIHYDPALAFSEPSATTRRFPCPRSIPFDPSSTHSSLTSN